MKWNYLVADLSSNASEAEHVLNRYGDKGWELVTVKEIKQPRGTKNSSRAFFKKEQVVIKKK